MSDVCDTLHIAIQNSLRNVRYFLERAEKGGRDWYPIHGLKFDPGVLKGDEDELVEIAARLHELRKRMKEVA